MSNRYSGRQSEPGSEKINGNKGVARKNKEQKRIAARQRQEEYNDLVARVAEKNNVSVEEARTMMKNRNITSDSLEVG